jgi:isoquinoline 1-oxidoreductase
MTTRREFLKIAGKGIIILYTVDFSELMAQRTFQMRGYPTDFNSYLRVGEDGRVTLFTGKIEMGQGVFTSLPQMLAEELDVPITSIDPVLGDTDLCPWDMGTFGSMSTRFFGPPMRQAAAEARAVLLDLGSERLGVPLEALGTRDGSVHVVDEPSTAVTYADLVQGRRIERTVDGDVAIKPWAEHRVSGKPMYRLDAVQKVTGRAEYTADVRLPGMLYAKVLRPPAHGSRLVSVDVSGAESVEGALVVRDGDLVAVLHELPDVAEEARTLIRAEWETPATGPGSDNIFEHLRANVPEARVVTEGGSLDAGRAEAVTSVDATYHAHYVAHAPMEPHAAVVHIEGDHTTVWASTQTPFPVRRMVAQTLDCPEENVRVITPFVGGGFGGKASNPQIPEAVRLAGITGRPVSLSWTRQEEFFYDGFRPATIVDVSAGVGSDKRVAFWDYANMHGGNRSSDPVYHFPNHRVTSAGGWGGRGPGFHPLAVGAWRGPGANVNHFAMESHMDLLAQAAGMNPLEFRLANLTDERMRRVLERAAEMFGRDWAPAPSGRGYGLALGTDAGTFVATMAEVTVDEARGRVQVERIVCVQDMGEIVNPEGARIQMEGCLTMGLGYTFTEEIRFDKGAIANENFDSYQLPEFSWLPEIEVDIIDNPELGPQGGGEPAITTVGAVIANAIHDAAGVRMYELPMTPGRVRRAIEAG